MTRLIAWTALAALMILGPAMVCWPADDVPIVTATPPLSDEVIHNPGKGWVLYGLPGDKSPEVLEIGSVGYARFNWSQIEPVEGEYHWEVIDNAIFQWAQVGKLFAFGVMSANTSSPDEYITPKWVFDAGAEGRRITRQQVQGHASAGEQVVPVWDDAIFVEKLRNFLVALAARYDGNPFLAWIDIKAYGNWGQQTLAFVGGEPLTDEQLEDRIRMHQAVFHKTPLAMSWGDAHHRAVYSWLIEQGVWLRDDGAGGSSNGTDTRECFGKVPAIFETFFGYEYIKARGWWEGNQDQIHWGWTLAECIQNGKPSYVGFQSGQGFMDAERPLIRGLANMMGYHFVLREARFPAVVTLGGPISIEMKWENLGVAPLYLPCEVAVALLEDSGAPRQPQWQDTIRPTTWMPNVIQSETASATFSKPAPGRYRLAVGLFANRADPRPTYRIGNEGRTGLGWYVLGEAQVAEAGSPAAETVPRAPGRQQVSLPTTAIDTFGWTPLHWQATWGHSAEVRALCRAGADVNATDNRGRTPLHWAGNRATARALLVQGADLGARDDQQRTPLLCAASGGHLDVVRYLLDGGADISAGNYHGETALHLAAMFDLVDVARLLLQRGADPAALDNHGWTALRWTQAYDCDRTADLLRTWMQDHP